MGAGAHDGIIIREILPHNAVDLRIDCTPRTLDEHRPHDNRASDSRDNPRPRSNNRPIPDRVEPASFSWTGLLVLICKFLFLLQKPQFDFACMLRREFTPPMFEAQPHSRWSGHVACISPRSPLNICCHLLPPPNWLIQKKNQRGKCKAAEQDRPVPHIETKKRAFVGPDTASISG